MQAFAGKWLFKILALGGAGLYLASKMKSPKGAARVVSVTGNGEVECEPDFARLRVAVRTRDKVAKEASGQLQKKVAAVLEALEKQAQINATDLQTTNLSIRQDRHKPEGKEEYVTEYVAYTEVSVKVRELQKLGQVLDLANDAGIDELEGLEFDVHDSKTHKQRAMALAVKDARAQAEVLANNAGMRLGEVLRITDGPDYDMEPSGGMLSRSMGYAGAIATGSIAVHAQAHLKFELLPRDERVSF